MKMEDEYPAWFKEDAEGADNEWIKARFKDDAEAKSIFEKRRNRSGIPKTGQEGKGRN